MTHEQVSRRQFLEAAAVGIVGGAMASPASARVVGANDRLSIGIIGAGGRGTALMGEIASLRDATNSEVTAVCDVWRQARERACRQAEKLFGRRPRDFSRHRDLLALSDIDAVVIAPPDFAHALILARAARAGKDAYCEKPMATDIAEAREARKAVLEAERVVQIGTQRRSEGRNIAAAEAARSGVLGTVSRITMEVNFNHPRWRRGSGDVKKEDVDWEEFLLGKSSKPFDPARFRQWQLFRDFTSGIPGLWMSHYIDLVHWFMDDPYPRSAVSHGGVYVWKDGRETCDTFHTLLEYPKGFLASFAMGLGNSSGSHFSIHGRNGTLDCERWVLSGEGGAGSDRIKEEKPIGGRGGLSHMKVFLDCVRSRKRPNADIQAGYSHAVATILSADALRTGERRVFDPETHEIRKG